MTLTEQDIEKLKNVLATKEDFDGLAKKVDAGFDGLKKDISSLRKDIRYIHQDLIKHDERTERLIKLVKGEPLEEEEAR